MIVAGKTADCKDEKRRAEKFPGKLKNFDSNFRKPRNRALVESETETGEFRRKYPVLAKKAE
jgi:hypothetical protein